MSLKLGDWKTNFNGDEGVLTLQGVDVNGVVSGTFHSSPILGLWDETARRISFSFKVTSQIPYSPLFKGILMSTPRNPQPGQDIIWTLLGSFHAFELAIVQGQGGNARRSTFGWFAQITEVA
jgi:hypothetical protein